MGPSFQVKAAGKFKETKRTEGISTSDLIMRMLKDYNQYVMRNLARGYTRKDLGVSYVKVCSFTPSAFHFFCLRFSFEKNLFILLLVIDGECFIFVMID